MMTRLLLSAVLLTMLGGCSFGGQVVLAGASLVSYVHTDKTLSDHAVSMIVDEDCSIRHSANNEPYCQPLPGHEDLAADDGGAVPDGGPSNWGPGQVAGGAPVYCYRTLGDISCYAEPDPTASAYAAMQ